MPVFTLKAQEKPEESAPSSPISPLLPPAPAPAPQGSSPASETAPAAPSPAAPEPESGDQPAPAAPAAAESGGHGTGVDDAAAVPEPDTGERGRDSASAPLSPEPSSPSPAASSSAVEEKQPGQVRFTAWNLKNYLHLAAPPPPGSTEKAKPPRERAAVTALLTALRPDILGVCEMGSAADLAVLQAELKQGGLDLPNAEWVEGADSSRHLALLTRFPIEARRPVTNLRYVLDDSQFPVQRGFLDVTVRVNGGYTLRLVGTHLKSRLDVPEADQALMRRNEAHLLRRHLDEVLTAEPEANVLVYGDFNDSRDQPSVKAIKGVRGAAAALTEIPAGDDSGERWTFYYPEADEYSRIDFLLASAGLMPEVRKGRAFLPGGRGWSRASDHRPVTLDFTADEAARPRSRSRSKTKAKPQVPSASP